LARADKREEECGEDSTHSSTERGRREKKGCRGEGREKRNPPARKVGREREEISDRRERRGKGEDLPVRENERTMEEMRGKRRGKKEVSARLAEGGWG